MEEPKLSAALDEAMRAGFTHAVPMRRCDLVAHEAVREMCADGKCQVYGKSWACPPNCGTLSECAARLDPYAVGILVQSVGDVADSFDIEGMYAVERVHKARFYQLIDALRPRFPALFPLGAGACKVCEKCAYPEKCRFPDRAISSMEAYGFLITEVCENCRVKYAYGGNTIAFTSCILLY